MKFVVLLCAALGLGACTVQPLYGTFTAGGAPSISTHLSQIEIPLSTTRNGVTLRNELTFILTGGGVAVKDGRYKLDIALEQNISPSQYEQISGRATTELLYIAASYVLTDAQNKTTLYTSKSFARASYDRDINRFANVRAQRDAEDRAIRTLAQEIRNSLAAHFAQTHP